MEPRQPIPGIPVNRQSSSISSVPGVQKDWEKPKGLLEGIDLKMTAKGRYYWDIQVYGDLDEGDVLRLKEIDTYLRREFPENVTNIPDSE